MPKPKLLQLSGAKKRQIAKQKAASERSVIASAPRLDRYLIHSLTKEDNRNNDNDVKVEKEVSTSAKSKYVESDSTETSDAQTQSSDSDSDQSLPSDDDEQRNESKDF
jgi:hypothetical protein